MRAALILALAAFSVAGGAAAGPALAERPDETALRYYAAERRPERVAAETERLRARFPDWQPPADLWSAEPGGEDEGPFWDLLAAGRLAELRSALAERVGAEPGFKPSKALTRAIARRELHEAGLSLARAGRWADLSALADARAVDLDPADIELAGSVAEGFARTERAPDAAALLARAIEAPGVGPEARRAAILRALAILPMAEVDRLGAPVPAADLAPIRIDLVRGRIAAVLHNEAGQSVPEEDLAAFAAYADTAADPNQPALVAWLALKQRRFPDALAWFKRAISRGGDAMVAHGLALTLRELGRRREAEEVAYAWREPLVNNAILFIDLLETDLTREIPPPVEPERLRRYAEVTAATASGEGAQALGWYAYNTCQFETAQGWFRRAVAWFPKEATVYGYALSLRRTHREQAFVELVNRYDGLFPKVVDLLFRPASDRPMPCEEGAARPAAAASAPASAYLDLGARQPAQGRVPAPDEIGRAAAALPKIRRRDFPVPVRMENDLRAAPTGAAEIAGLTAWAARPIGRPATTARRVPGVGPMPYERFGFALKPAWSGEEAASSPTAAEKPAPAGTLWSETQAVLDVARTGSIRRTAPRLPATSRTSTAQ